MPRKIVAIWLSLVMMLGFVVVMDNVNDFIPKVKGTILYVNKTGSGGIYSSIQDAINASSDGDTIRVSDGTYYENVWVDKRISLIGNGSKTTVIDGGKADHQNVVTIISNGVNLSGFGITNSYIGHEFGGIGVQSSDNRIFHNHCLNNLYGIILWGNQNRIFENSFSNNEREGIFVKSSGNIIENNTCSNSFDRSGIWLYICSDNIVSNNTCSNNSKNGISLYQSHNNKIFNNKCINSIIYDGIFIYESSNNELWNNTLSFNNEGGLGLSHFADNNILDNNIVTENNIGVNIYDNCSINSVMYNNVILNTLYGIYMSGSFGNRIHHNNIIDNPNQAYDDRSDNFWDDGYPHGGNYWSDYWGIDLNSTPAQDVPPPDGMGDTPYIIDSDSMDNYPLMSPSGNFILLYEGWNLISIPLLQSDSFFESILSPLNGLYDSVQYYNSSDHSDNWKHTHTSKPAHTDDLETIDLSMGFWIHIIAEGRILFEYSGTQPTSNKTILLHPGWNMVGYPSLTSYNRTEGLNNLTFNDHVDAIWSYDVATQKWEEMGESDYFIVGRGYYIHVKSECEREVPM